MRAIAGFGKRKYQKKALLGFVLLVLSVVTSSKCFSDKAQSVENTRSFTVYGSEWFDRFVPSTAADMLSAIPSFRVKGTEADRGFGRINENVLINGKPTKGKGASSQKLLSKIPASSVIRIEVGDAAKFDVTGVSGLVANVILKQQRFQGSLTYSPEFRRYADSRLTNGSIFITSENDAWSYTVGLKNDASREGDRVREVVLGENRQVTNTNSGRVKRRFDEPTFSLDVKHNVSKDYQIGAEIEVSERTRVEDENLTVQDSQGQNFFINTGSDEDGSASRVTLRLDRKFGDKSIELVALNSNIERLTENVSRQQVVDDLSFVSQGAFSQDTNQRESIIQATYKARDDESFWELSAELAYNSLESEGRSAFSNSGAPLELIRDVNSTGNVKEYRGQVVVTRRLSYKNWSIDAAIGGEYSELTASTLDGENRKSFYRPKGALSASVVLDEFRTFRVSLEREVSQLDFFDFLGNENLQFNLSSGANTDLEPSQFWNLKAELESRFNLNTSHTLRLNYKRVEDIVDRTLINGRDAAGNIGDGEIWSIESELSWRPKSAAFSQWQLNLNNLYQESELTDPVTGMDREFSANRRWLHFLDLSYELLKKPITLGVKTEYWRDSKTYRSSEIIDFKQEEPQLVLYLKHADFYSCNLTFEIVNLLDHVYKRETHFYSGDRSNSEPTSFETRRTDFSPFVFIKLQKIF